MKHIRLIRNFKYYIALALGTLLLLSGCRSTELKVLEDSASIIHLTTGDEVSRSRQDKAVVLGKQVYAQVIIEYQPRNNYTKEVVYEEIVGILEKNGWKRDEWNTDPDYFNASLTQGYSVLLVSVLIDPNENRVSVKFVNRNP